MSHFETKVWHENIIISFIIRENFLDIFIISTERMKFESFLNIWYATQILINEDIFWKIWHHGEFQTRMGINRTIHQCTTFNCKIYGGSTHFCKFNLIAAYLNSVWKFPRSISFIFNFYHT